MYGMVDGSSIKCMTLYIQKQTNAIRMHIIQTCLAQLPGYNVQMCRVDASS